ncbi:hypothetical protein [Flavobacterium sp. SORGH_AS_0622]|uniref:hypothetical protein n=1 Tax=Flavobacterium sp. SORGH_AS_0622 TaxID=3041772 RepID=UPI0027889659|nr:hypothetical protein [Flavobacterium sp. SORGH_AS_0622]MDQ1166289.1 hypothetical protein [Flavobacterium sp. SORGH_AS_0622]
MKNTFLLLLLLGIFFSANAQQKPVFQKLRYEDDFQYLKPDSTKKLVRENQIYSIR